MQTIFDTDLGLLNAEQPITLHLYIDNVKQTFEITKATYKDNVASGEEFSIGNVCASSIELTVDAQDLLIKGKRGKVTWSVGQTEYPLIEGFIDECTEEGFESRITIYDYLYTLGGLNYTLPTNLKTNITLSTLLTSIASQMEVTVDDDALYTARNITANPSNLGNSFNCYTGLSAIALLCGGNIVMTRDNKLTIKRYEEADFSDDPYEENVDKNSETFSVSGVEVYRTDIISTTDEDGTVTEEEKETVYRAGSMTNGVTFTCDIADQNNVNSLYNAIKDLSFKSGNASFGLSSIMLEAGDIITVDSLYGEYKHAINEITFEIDGGCKSNLTSAGKVSDENSTTTTGASGGVSGSGGGLTQELRSIKADYGRFKTLVADNIEAQTANIKQVKAESIQVSDLEAKRGYISDLISQNIQVESLNGNVIKNSHILAKALSDEALETILGVTVYYRAEAPTDPEEGDLWYRTVVSDDDKTPTIMYEYVNGEWIGTEFDQKVIRANSITAQEIASNTITANNIKSGSITTDKLMVGEVGNIYDIKYDTFEGCYINADGTQNVYRAKSDNMEASIANNAIYGSKALHLTCDTPSASTSILALGTKNNFDTYINIDHDTKYTISCCVKMIAGTSIRLGFLENTGSRGFGTEASSYLGWDINVTGDEWVRVSRSFTSKSDTRSVKLYIGFPSNTAGECLVDAFQIEKGDLTPFKPASFTKIDGSAISTSSIKADRIDVEDLFAQNIKATGTIDGAKLISRGAKEGEYIVVDEGKLVFFRDGTEKGEILCWDSEYDENESYLLFNVQKTGTYGGILFTYSAERGVMTSVYKILPSQTIKNHFEYGVHIEGGLEANGGSTIVGDTSITGTFIVNNEFNHEAQVHADGHAGDIFLVSQVPPSGDLGIWAMPKGTNISTWITHINHNGTIYHPTSSDRRLKNHIEELSEREAEILLTGLKAQTFTYKADENGEEVLNGFYAQDLRDILTSNGIGYRGYLNVMKEDEDGKYSNQTFDLNEDEESVRYSIDYAKMLPILWKGWQMHEERIKQLEKENSKLESRLEKLERMILENEH